jgi:hypothetical protein
MRPAAVSNGQTQGAPLSTFSSSPPALMKSRVGHEMEKYNREAPLC